MYDLQVIETGGVIDNNSGATRDNNVEIQGGTYTITGDAQIGQKGIAIHAVAPFCTGENAFSIQGAGEDLIGFIDVAFGGVLDGDGVDTSNEIIDYDIDGDGIKDKINNFSLLVANKTMPNAYRLLKDSADAFLYPGHVNAITGEEECRRPFF